MGTSNAKRYFGSVRRVGKAPEVGTKDTRRWQARYTGPDGRTHNGPVTWDTQAKAEAWLSLRQAEILKDAWLPPEQAKQRAAKLSTYANAWLEGREIKPRTRDHYRKLLDNQILPTLGALPLTSITPTIVREWHQMLGKENTPTLRAHAYGLLRTILQTAVTDDLLPSNPCRIKGAGSAPRVIKVEPASVEELEVIAASVPDRYRSLVLLTAWCALRFGEATELRRRDVDLSKGVLHIRRAVVRVEGEVIVGSPKSNAGTRDVAIPPHLVPMLRAHMDDHAEPGPDGLLFPARSGGHLAPASLSKVFYPARDKAGRPDLRFHDLRHTGAVLAASTGATLAELMARLGHSTPGAAMRYQHAAKDRDAEIASALSALATGKPTPKSRRRTASGK
jgi:integrase